MQSMIFVCKYEKNESILFRNTFSGGRTLREMISTEITMVFTSAWGQVLRRAMQEESRGLNQEEES